MRGTLTVLFVIVFFAGCSPAQMHEKYVAQAIAAVDSQLSEADRKTLTLKGEASPWGQGVIVYNANAARPDDVRAWVYTGQAFAIDDASRRLTPGLLPVARAPRDVADLIALEQVPPSEIRRRVFRAISDGTFLPETK